MNIQLGMGFSLTFLTVWDLFILFVILRAYWPWLVYRLQSVGSPVPRFMLFAVLLAAGGALLLALFRQGIRLEIAEALVWWLLVWFSYFLLAAVAFDFASAHDPDSDPDGRYEIVGILIGGLVGMAVGIGLALLIHGFSIGGGVGLVLALFQIIVGAVHEYRYQSAKDPAWRHADTVARQVNPFWRTFAKWTLIYLIFSIPLNVLYTAYFTYVPVVTAAGFAAIFANLDRVPEVLRLAALNMLTQTATILIVLAVLYHWSLSASSTQDEGDQGGDGQGGNGHTPPRMSGPRIPRGLRRAVRRRKVVQRRGDPHPKTLSDRTARLARASRALQEAADARSRALEPSACAIKCCAAQTSEICEISEV